MNHRFILEPYKGPATRHTCPECNHNKCFSKYVDTENKITFPNYVGRCNREQKCGYHYTPRLFFEQHPEQTEKTQFCHKITIQKDKIQPVSFLDYYLVEQSIMNYEENRLYQFLSTLFGKAEVLKLFHLYKVGTAHHWPGATVFWQIDIEGKVRTGKVMLYNPASGRRIKKPHNYITWVHSLLHKNEFNLRQCFFGEHLLNIDKIRPIALVESEKTALIASLYLPQYIWIASGGKNGCFKEECLAVFKGRVVVLFPDLGATDSWSTKIPMMKRLGIKAILFDYLEINATNGQQMEGYDIADFLIKKEICI